MINYKSIFITLFLVSSIATYAQVGSGATGIGTEAPEEMLHVAEGNIRVDKINENIGAETNKIVVADANGVLKTVNATMPKFFYMPSVIMPTAEDQVPGMAGATYNAGTFTVNLHANYQSQFNTPAVSNTGATTTLPVIAANALDYHIVWYDNTVFENVVINNLGELSYTIKATAEITVGSFMNIVFVVK
ncbi:MAG: hypothetical protein ACTJGD_11925 [Mesonia hippocampi]|uniref:hypothetical protein n=1 Tax=Mesonia hippocampi TaxID=1628250 RepID=UPI003F94695E